MKAIALFCATAMAIVGMAAVGNGDEVKSRLSQGVTDLRGCVMALNSAKMERQGSQLEQIVDHIAEWTIAHQTVRRTDVGALQDFVQKLRSSASMYSSSNMASKAAFLSTQADTVDRVSKVFATVAEDVPDSAASTAPGGAASSRGGFSHLTVRVSFGMVEANQAQGPAGDAEAAGGAYGPGPGRQFGMGAGPMAGRGGPGGAAMMPGGAVAMRPSLKITLVEMNQSFSSPTALRQYTSQNVEKLSNTAISFEIGPEVMWKDVMQVVNAFSGAEFTGALEFVGFAPHGGTAAKITGPGAEAAVSAPATTVPKVLALPADTPAVSSAGPAAPSPSTAPASAPASTATAAPDTSAHLNITPLGPGQTEGQ